MVRLVRLLFAAALPAAILAEDAAGRAALSSGNRQSRFLSPISTVVAHHGSLPDGKHSRARRICHAPKGVAE